jgi:hypothetical protein
MPDLGGKGMGWLRHHDRYDVDGSASPGQAAAAEAQDTCCGSIETRA